jgi:hypothetical protein
MTGAPETIESMAKAMSYSLRALNDKSEDADEHWLYTGPEGREKWEQAAKAALDVMRDTDISQARIAELEAALLTVRNDAMQEAIGCCCPHVDDDQMDAQAKTQCADAIAALKAKP